MSSGGGELWLMIWLSETTRILMGVKVVLHVDLHGCYDDLTSFL